MLSTVQAFLSSRVSHIPLGELHESPRASFFSQFYFLWLRLSSRLTFLSSADSPLFISSVASLGLVILGVL